MRDQKLHRVYPPILERSRELRQPQTPAEQRLWAALRDRRLGGYKFRRQHPIDRFIVDFFCHECSLVLEVDGDSHATQAEYDQARTEWLNDRGYTVIRFTNQDIYKRFPGVQEAILEQCQRLSGKAGLPTPDTNAS
jgi:very-short-patch-repair endonuclease